MVAKAIVVLVPFAEYNYLQFIFKIIWLVWLLD